MSWLEGSLAGSSTATLPQMKVTGESCDLELTMLDVLHVQVQAGHQNTHCLRTLVAQQLLDLQWTRTVIKECSANLTGQGQGHHLSTRHK